MFDAPYNLEASLAGHANVTHERHEHHTGPIGYIRMFDAPMNNIGRIGQVPA